MTLNNSYRAILRVALPIMFGTFVQFIVNFVDVSFLGHISDDPDRTKLAVSGVGNAVLIYSWFFMLGAGLSQGVQILIARREGETNYRQVGQLFRQSVIVQLILGLIAFLSVTLLLDPFLKLTIGSPSISGIMGEYLHTRSFGFFFTFLLFPFTSFYVGTARTQILILITLITAGTNVFLDYGLIFGHYGLPEMGESGAALASAIAEGLGLLSAIIYTLFSKQALIKYELFGAVKFRTDMVVRILKIGVPLMAQGILAMTGWLVFFFIITTMGEQEIAISQIIRSLYYLPLVSIFGFGATTKTYVSNLIASKRLDEVVPTVKKITLLNVIICFVLSHAFFFYPEVMIRLVTDQPELITATADVLQVVAGAMLLFAIATVLFNVMAGSGDTLVAFLTEAFVIVIYLVLCYLIGVVWNKSLTAVWCMEYMYFGSFILLSAIYVRSGRWKKIKV